jgi:hypothetical protein
VIAGIIGRDSPTDYLSLESLPAANSWQQVPLGGGFAIVTQEGLFALDDWTQRQLDFASLRSAFQDAAALNHNLRRLELDALQPLLNQVVALLHSDRRSRRSITARHGDDIDDLLPAVARIGAELAKLRGSHATPHYHPDGRAVHDALDRQWGLTQRLTAIDAEVRSLETSLRSLGELRIARISRFVAIHGFALLLAATFADALAKFVWSMLGWSIRGFPAHMPEWPPFVAFLVATAILSLLFRWRLSRQDPLRDN